MAVAYYNGTQSTAFSGSTGTNYSFSFDNGSGSNPALLLGLSYLWSGTAGSFTVKSGSQAISTVTGATGTDADNVVTLLYGITGAQGLPAGVNTVSIVATQSVFLDVAALAVTGANQTGGTTTFANGAGGNGTVNPASKTITSATGDLVFVVASGFPTTFTGAVSPGTIIGSAQNVGLNSNAQYANGAASVAATLTMSGNGNWSIAGVDIVAAAGGGGAPVGGLIEVRQSIKRASFF